MTVDWDAWNAEGGPRYPHEKVIQWVFRSFPAEQRRGSRALDLACGSGVHTVFLAREGFDVTAVDASAVGAENTRRRLSDRGLSADLIVADAAEVDLRLDSFDLAICVGGLDSMLPSAADAAVGKVATALKAGRGRALFLFASDRDYRVTGDDASRLSGFSRSDVDNMFTGRFAVVWIDRYVTTYGGGAIEQNEWLVTVSR